MIRARFHSSPLAAPLAALVAGAITPLAFAPFHLWPLQLATLACMFRLACAAPSFKRGFFIGWAYEFGWFAAGVHWLYISMHRYGGLPSWMAAAAVALLALALSLYAALAMGVANRLAARWSLRQWQALILVYPPMWTLAEWTRGWAMTGFPWVSSGYAHSIGPLSGYAPVAGVYGIALIGAVIAASAVALASVNVTAPKKSLAALALVLFAAGEALHAIDWTSPTGNPVSVRLLQGNVPQNLKFAPEQIAQTLELYHDMITAAPADLIVTPETAIPLLSRQLPPDYLGLLSSFAARSGSNLIIGIPVSDGPNRYANSVIGIDRHGVVAYRYDKHHLVPFGEFIPWGARWFVDMMRIPLGDFTRGAALQEPFVLDGQRVLPNICYEDLFGEEIADQLAVDGTQATMLLNVSNIAWFGDSVALPQHLQISQMRALETGRPMLRATNTGATAVIGPKGEVLARLPPFRQAALAARVQGYAGLTPYIRFGNMLPVGLALAMLAAAWVAGRSRVGKTV